LILIYEPKDGEPRTWDLAELNIRSSEGEDVERVTGREFAEVMQGVRAQDLVAVRAYAWMLLRRDDPALRYTGFDPFIGEIRVELSPAEREEIAANVLRDSPDMDDEERANLAEFLKGARGDGPELDAITAPKDQDPDSASGESPTAG